MTDGKAVPISHSQGQTALGSISGGPDLAGMATTGDIEHDAAV